MGSAINAGAEQAAFAPALASWHLLVDDVYEPRTGAYNMALDHALLEHAQQTRECFVRFYRWQPACLSFGRNQPARGLYDPATAKKLGIEIVRRPTGGMAVLHDCELTYAVVAPIDVLDGPRAAYAAINRALVAGLRDLGVAAMLAPESKRSAFGTMHPCFAEPAAGEVIAEGCKLVGSAQRCEKRTLLQHGSILLDGMQSEVAQIAAVPFDLVSRATNLRTLLGFVPEAAHLTAAMASGFEELCGTSLAPTKLTASVAERAHELIDSYQSPEWTWRK